MLRRPPWKLSAQSKTIKARALIFQGPATWINTAYPLFFSRKTVTTWIFIRDGPWKWRRSPLPAGLKDRIFDSTSSPISKAIGTNKKWMLWMNFLFSFMSFLPARPIVSRHQRCEFLSQRPWTLGAGKNMKVNNNIHSSCDFNRKSVKESG